MDSVVCVPSLTTTRVGFTLLCHRRMAQAPIQKGVCMFRAGFGGLGYPCFGVPGSSPCLTVLPLIFWLRKSWWPMLPYVLHGFSRRKAPVFFCWGKATNCESANLSPFPIARLVHQRVSIHGDSAKREMDQWTNGGLWENSPEIGESILRYLKK